jgi:hypothetical protein
LLPHLQQFLALSTFLLAPNPLTSTIFTQPALPLRYLQLLEHIQFLPFKMPFKWSEASERDLLLATIAGMGNPSSTIWEDVALKVATNHGGVLNGNAASYALKLSILRSFIMLEGSAADVHAV